MNQYTEAELFGLAIQDEHILEFARGYYGLSLYEDAEAELSNASLFTRSRTDFLELRSQIHGAKGEWLKSLECADKIIEQEPDDAMGYIHRLHWLGLSVVAIPSVPEASGFCGERSGCWIGCGCCNNRREGGVKLSTMKLKSMSQVVEEKDIVGRNFV